MFVIPRLVSDACAFKEDSQQRRKQLELGYQPDSQHIGKVTGPLGNMAFYFKCGIPEVLPCVFLLYS